MKARQEDLGSCGGGRDNIETFEAEHLTCMWRQLEMSLVSLKNMTHTHTQKYDTIQVVGKMGNPVSTYFNCVGCRSRM